MKKSLSLLSLSSGLLDSTWTGHFSLERETAFGEARKERERGERGERVFLFLERALTLPCKFVYVGSLLPPLLLLLLLPLPPRKEKLFFAEVTRKKARKKKNTFLIVNFFTIHLTFPRFKSKTKNITYYFKNLLSLSHVLSVIG